MSTCGREFHVACMRSKSLSFEAAGRRSPARHRPTKYPTCSIGGISSEKRGEHITDVLVAIEITLNSLQIESSMIRNRTPNRNSGCWATTSFNNALWKAAFTGIASNTNVAIMVPQIEA
ncbi:hypothetical protein TNCV_5113391 [Trichonephila clavipes]|nr:hypothetical protein TNCV_5113391 [Trichonephila clavipes]